MEAITNILWRYAVKDSIQQIYDINMDDAGVIPMDNYYGKINGINLEKQHSWGCPVYRKTWSNYHVQKTTTGSRRLLSAVHYF